MKSLFLAAAVVGVLSPTGAAAVAADAAVDETLIALEKQSWVGWQKHDGRFYEGFLSEDHVEMGFGGPSNKAEVIAGVKEGCTVASYSVDHFKVTQFSDDSALVTYHAAQDTKCGGVQVPSPVWVSSLYVERGGRWVNALYQQSQAQK
jgi:hypothetical protein